MMGCALSPGVSCLANETPAILDSLYFGTQQPNGIVTEQEWRQFVSEIITPRFVNGHTSWQANGQWRSASGEIQNEQSYVLQIVHPDSAEQDANLQEIIRHYKERFDQESVLRVRVPTCSSF